MPTIALTDLTLKSLKPAAGKRITYLCKQVKGFGVMVLPSGHRSYVYTFGANRQRVKIGDVGVVKLADARRAALNLAAERQLGRHQAKRAPTFASAIETFLEVKATKLKP